MPLHVHFLPELIEPRELEGVCVLVIDVLRATTTIVTALAEGAAAIVPCLTVEEARARAGRAGDQALLGGERGGQKIEGFDLGNSPSEYAAERVQNRVIYFTTTNGTRALQHAAHAAETVCAAFANFSTVCDHAAQQPVVHILCAGTQRQITREDVLLAGALAAERLAVEPDSEWNDQALLAAEAWREARRTFAAGQPLAVSLRSSQGARNLMQIGQQRDVEIAAQLDRYSVLPFYDAPSGRIRLR